MDSVYQLPHDDTKGNRTHWKTGVRVIGIAESFQKTDKTSYVVGIIMRGDMRIDGFAFCNPAVGGKDSTDKLLEMYEEISRQDVHAWILGGCVISWFNTVDIHRLYEATALPVICVSYEPSEGLEKYIREYFPDDWISRIDAVNAIGSREKVLLSNGFEVFIVSAGIDIASATNLVNQFTQDGRVPEPVRVARQLAQYVRKKINDDWKSSW